MLTITQEQIDRAALVVVVGDDGLFEWSSTREPVDCALVMVGIANAMLEQAGYEPVARLGGDDDQAPGVDGEDVDPG